MVWPPGASRLTGDVIELSQCIPEQDAGSLFEAIHHYAVWRHMAGQPKSPGELAALLSARIRDGCVVWVVRLLRPHVGCPAGTVVGTSSYLDVSPADARLEIGATAYSPEVWGSKVNPETKFLLLSFAFDSLKAGRVQFKTDVRNTRSQLAIARLGARFEGILRRHLRRDDGTVRDSVLFSIIAEEWPSVRDRLRARLDGSR